MCSFCCYREGEVYGWGEPEGLIDEVRISRYERNAAWIKACYHSQLPTAGFLTFGSEQEPPAEEWVTLDTWEIILENTTQAYILDTWNLTLSNTPEAEILDTWEIILENTTQEYILDTWNISLSNMTISEFTIDQWNITLSNTSLFIRRKIHTVRGRYRRCNYQHHMQCDKPVRNS